MIPVQLIQPIQAEYTPPLHLLAVAFCLGVGCCTVYSDILVSWLSQSVTIPAQNIGLPYTEKYSDHTG